MTWGSLSTALSASDDLVFCCARGSMAMASAQRMPAVRHCCSALAMRVAAALRLLARRSRRTASSQRRGALVFLRRATSSSDRALPSSPWRSSRLAAKSQRGTQSAHSLTARPRVSRAPSIRRSCSSSCALMISSFHERECALSAGPSSLSAASGCSMERSRTTDFIQTRSVPARSRAVARRERARSGSRFSDSSLTAASQTCSESGLALKASLRMARAATMSPESHFSLAPISQST
mmetsp:Transcript_75924/g.201730  ORF Transcript_75924/g.201730 Transcript_75924/m.201730 type:complete len:237 (-) Transcript_75924:1777-2487(-)